MKKYKLTKPEIEELDEISGELEIDDDDRFDWDFYDLFADEPDLEQIWQEELDGLSDIKD